MRRTLSPSIAKELVRPTPLVKPTKAGLSDSVNLATIVTPERLNRVRKELSNK